MTQFSNTIIKKSIGLIRQLSSEEILKVIKTQPYSQKVQNKTITYSVCEKLNKSGLFYNERVLFIFDCDFIAYTNKFKKETKLQLPFNKISEIPQFKAKISLDSVKEYDIENNILTIKYSIKNIETNQIQQNQWIIKMKNNKMAQEWIEYLDHSKNQHNKRVSDLSKIELRKNGTKQNEVTNTIVQNQNQVNQQGLQNSEQKFWVANSSKKILQNQKQMHQNQEIKLIKKESIKLSNYSEKSERQIEFSPKILPKSTKFIESQFIINSPQQHNDPSPNIDNNQPLLKSQSKKNGIILYDSRKVDKDNQQNLPNFISFKVSTEQPNIENIQNKQPQQHDWNFQFILQNDSPELILKFKLYSEKLVKMIINQFGLPQNKRTYRPYLITSDVWEYNIQYVRITLGFSSLKTIQIYKSTKQTIFSQAGIKKLNNELKNMDYLIQTTKNKGRIRVPLANIIQYKGIVCLVKSKINEIQKKSDIINLQNQFNNLETQTGIRKSIFKHPESITLKFLDHKAYETKAKSQNINIDTEQFNLVLLDNVYQFLPQDILYKDKDPMHKQIRSELMLKRQNILQGRHFYNELKKDKNEAKNQKQIEQVQNISNQILNQIQNLLREWQQLQIIIISSEQLSDLFHKHGVNIRYLGVVYQQTKSTFVKRICISEICARCIKIILRYQLQDQIKKYYYYEQDEFEQSKKEEYFSQFQENLVDIAIDLLNKILGDSAQTIDIWKLINKQAVYNYHVQINKQFIDRIYFLKSLIQNCNIQVQYNNLQTNFSLFKNIEYFSRKTIKGFKLRSKTYNLTFTDKYQTLATLIQEYTEQNKNQVIDYLKLQNNQLSQDLKLTNIYSDLLCFLSNYVSPFQDHQESSMFRHLNIYQMVYKLPPTMSSLNLLMMKIKWAIKNNNNAYIATQFQNALNILNKWCGQYHPIKSEFCQLFAVYYSSIKNYQEAITMSKSSIINLLKSLDNNNIRIAQSYYQLANIYWKISKKDEAFLHYKKAKIIFQINNKSNEVGYALLCIRISENYLNQKNQEECTKLLLSSLNILQNNLNQNSKDDHEKQLVQVYELLSRSLEISKKQEELDQLQEQCSKKLKTIQQDENKEKILRIILNRELSKIKKENIGIFERMFQVYKTQKFIPQNQFIYQYLNKVFDQNFLQTIREYCFNITRIYQYLILHDIFSIWKGIREPPKDPIEEFLGVFQCLFHLLGEHYIIGIIKYHT